MAGKKKTRSVTKSRSVPKQRYNSDTGGYDTVYVTEDYTTTETYTDYSSDTSSYGGSDTGSYSGE